MNSLSRACRADHPPSGLQIRLLHRRQTNQMTVANWAGKDPPLPRAPALPARQYAALLALSERPVDVAS